MPENVHGHSRDGGGWTSISGAPVHIFLVSNSPIPPPEERGVSFPFAEGEGHPFTGRGGGGAQCEGFSTQGGDG